MAYQKKTWLARLGQGLNKFIFNGGSKVTLESSPDVVTQEGTPLSAENMNDLETRIDNEFTNVNEAVSSLSGRFGVAETVFNSFNFNDYTIGGMYRINNLASYSNYPSTAESWGQLLVVRGDGDTCAQIYFEYSSGKFYKRGCGNLLVSPVWSAWS